MQISFLQSYQHTLIVNYETGKSPMNVVSNREKIMLHLSDLPKEDKGLDLVKEPISHDPLRVAETPDWPALTAHHKALLLQSSQTAFQENHFERMPIPGKHEILMVALVKHQDPSKKGYSCKDSVEVVLPPVSRLTD